ncbi:MAG: insulinase family protein [Desulfovibrio sp.]|nr:insulinase family protein [Desulfovibrio sp.]MBI4959533.1 insulinase family protein [Desulfovibrio sp.]
MTRKLFGYILLAAALVAGYLYHVRVQQGPPRTETAANAPAGVQQSQAKQDGIPVKDGRLLAKLPNGLTVLVLEDKRFPLVAERLYVRAGSAYEAKGQEGISHLLEHMVFNSTAKRPKGGVASAIESAGGDTNAATSFDYTQYMADLPSASWKLGLDVLQDMIFGAKFDPAELEQEKKVVISELERGQDEPGQRLFQMSQGQVWHSIPYKHPIIGFRETVNAVTPEDMRAYIKRLYQPQSMLLVVVGDVNAQDVYKEAVAVFGGLSNDRPVIPPDIQDLPANTAGPSAKAAGGNWNKCYLRLDFAVPGMHSAKDVPLEVLSDLLGGGKTSTLYRKFVYEEQLADSLDVSAITLERGGMFSIEATLDQDKVQAFWGALVKELAGLTAKTFGPEELERSKLNIEDQLFRAKETLRGLATKLAYYQFFGFGLEGEANALYNVRHTDAAELQGLLDAYLKPGNASLSLLMPGVDQAGADAAAETMLAELKGGWPQPAVAQAAKQAGGASQTPEVVDLGGGRTVVLLADPTMPYASVNLTYRGGDGLLTPEQQGLGELTAKALTRSTQKRSAPALNAYLEDRASSIAASSSRDTFSISARYPERFSKDILNLLAEVVGEPAFAQAEVDRAKKMQLAQIAEASDRPTSLAFRHLFPFLYPGSTYGYFRAGLPEEVAAFTPGNARAFWEKQRAMPWVLAVCGVFDRKAVLDLASKLAAGPAAIAPGFPAPAWSAKHDMSLTLAERNQTHLFWIFPLPGKLSSDTPALEVLKTALAGQGGLLFQDLRDKQGLGYSVTAFLWQSPNTGFLAFYIGTTPDKEAQAMDGFKRVAAELASKGLEDALINRAKSSLEGDYYQERQSLGSRSQEASQNLAMGYPLDFEREILSRVRILTGAQITEVAGKYLDPSKAYLLKIAP